MKPAPPKEKNIWERSPPSFKLTKKNRLSPMESETASHVSCELANVLGSYWRLGEGHQNDTAPMYMELNKCPHPQLKKG